VPRSPGDRTLHYAPSTPVEIVASDDLEARAGEILAREEKVAVLAMRPPLHTQRHMTWINAGKKPDTYAHNLYSHLRTLDRTGCVRIFVQSLPQDEKWAAILDRLQRASGMGDDSLELSVS
jgi:L-threonylcarbamoyladenylate synthase